MYQRRMRNAETIKYMCSDIFVDYKLDITSYNKELPSHLKNEHDPVPSKLWLVQKKNKKVSTVK